MSKMKTEFELQSADRIDRTGVIEIIGTEEKHTPYVRIEMYNGKAIATIKDKELELFAVNILKAIKSKHLKQ